MGEPTFRDLYGARLRIAPHVVRTPLAPSPLGADDGRVLLKLETQQVTGAFKIRGAANKLLSLTDDERARGVIAVSTGNHGRAVAHMGRALGIQVHVCLSELVPQNKRAAIEALGATLHVAGRGQDEATERFKQLIADRGYIPVHPFDDPAVIAGQGTIGLEIVEDAPEVARVVVPLSGGGLLSGIALAVKSIDPGIRVVGVSAEASPGMIESLRAGRPVDIPEPESLADSLGGGIGPVNRYTLAMVDRLVDEHAIVSEDEIARAMAWTFRHHGVIVEGAGAVGIAALLFGKLAPCSGTTVVVVSGKNVDPDKLVDVIARHRG